MKNKTKGTQMAEEIRKKTNLLTPGQRQLLLKSGWKVIYSGPNKDKVRKRIT